MSDQTSPVGQEIPRQMDVEELWRKACDETADYLPASAPVVAMFANLVLEEAAKLCDTMTAEASAAMTSFPPWAEECAKAIRALKESP